LRFCVFFRDGRIGNPSYYQVFCNVGIEPPTPTQPRNDVLLMVIVPSRPLLMLLLLALVVRLGAGVWWQQRLPAGARFGFPDSESYWQLAASVSRGGPLATNPDRRVFRTPGYPLLLAPLFWLTDGEPPVLWARVLGAVLGTLAVGGIAVLAGLLFDRRAAVLAAAAAAVYPGGIAMSVFVLSEAPFAPLMILQLILCVLAWRSDGWRRGAMLALAAGLTAGAATLVRPSWLLFTPFAAAVALLLAERGRRRPAAWLVLWMLVGLTAAMMPWWVRNWRVTGGFVPTTLQVGESLYDGLSPQARGGSDMRFVDDFRRQLRAEDAARLPEAEGRSFEERLDRRMRDAALAWARENPLAALRLAWVKFRRMWSFWPNEPALSHWRFGLVMLAGYAPLLIGGLYGAWRFARRGWPYVQCLLPAVYFTGLHVVFVGSIRYRQPAMLALIVLAAGAASAWFGSPADHRGGGEATGAAEGSGR
jgi:4-amino-4-deoxy-L-arabinose transferase-like glycosyltransferase